MNAHPPNNGTCDSTGGRGASATGHPPGPPATAAAARDQVSALLQRAGISLDSVIAADTLLVTSELVTNAIRHGSGITTFHSDITDGTLHVSVGDNNPRGPAARTVTPGEPGGYGWPLIQRLAQHIHITSHRQGKTITASLRLT
ncbi:ATP-binding protein [Streptomyces virginiae]|uniref:ATP-binding protein n=1 Tax=Streptomyces virginiae TaxID=1961 RepID=UPI003417416D